MKPYLYLAIGVLTATSAHAGGYRVSLQGQKALAMGHTGVAVTDSAETVFFNPGSMVQLEADREFTGGITLLTGQTKYQNSDTFASDETDNPLGTPINAYYTSRISEQMSWGLGVYTPYGNKVEWPTDWAGSHLVNDINLQVLYLQPTISFALSDSTSIGFGPTYASGTVELNRNLSTSLTDTAGNRSNVTVKADGVDEWGYNLGLYHRISDQWSVGASYRSEIILKARGGDAEFENVPTTLSTTFVDGEFDADLPLPAELTLGVAYTPNDRVTVAFDVNVTYWDVYEELTLEFDNGLTSTNPRNYEDSMIYRFGVQYVYDDQWTLRGGLYVDESPVQDGYFAPETPRNDSLGLTLGASYQQSKNLGIDVSLLMLNFQEVDNSYDFYTEPNASSPSPFGGTYDTAAWSIGVGLTYKY